MSKRFGLSQPAYRAFLNVEIQPNEGSNAYFVDAATGKMPLYPSADKLITNNYPPLSFYIVALVGWFIGDPVLAGRLLSLIARIFPGTLPGDAVAARVASGTLTIVEVDPLIRLPSRRILREMLTADISESVRAALAKSVRATSAHC